MCAPAPVASPTTAALLGLKPIALVAAFSSAAAADARAADGSWVEQGEGKVDLPSSPQPCSGANALGAPVKALAGLAAA